MTDALSWPRAAARHLLPGTAVLAVFAALAPPLAANGLPPVWGMFAAVLLAVAPVQLVLARRAGVTVAAPDRRALLRLLPPTLLAALLAPGLVQWAEPRLHTWLPLPAWWRLDPDLAGRPGWQVAVTLTGWLVCFVVVGPLAEEVYFRGALLPRLPGRPALTSAVLFAVYHLWQPYAWLTVAVFALPLALAARRPGGLAVAAGVHAAVNLVTFAALLAGALRR